MSAPSFRVISLEEYRVWFEQHFELLRHRSPFHHPAWLEAVARAAQFDVGCIGVYEGRDLVAAVPGFLTQLGPFRLFGSPLRGTMTSYLGPTGLTLGDSTDELVDLVAACSRFARKQWGAVYTRFTLRDAPAEGLPQLDLSWKQQRPRSYRLDLTPGESALWTGLKSDCRRNIRKAQRLGIEIVPLDDARLFYQILDETFSRHNSASWHSERFFRSILNGLAPHDLLWAWGARYEDRIIAAGLFLYDDSEMHFLSGASSVQYGSLPTSYLLHWHAITTAASAGLRVFNSDASRIRSIDQFKESFKPTLERRYTLIWAPSYAHYAQRLLMSTSPYLRRFRRWLAKDRRVSLPST